MQPRPLNLRLANVLRLEMLPNSAQILTTEHLLATTNDEQQKEEIRFTVIKKPSFGQLQLRPVDRFMGSKTLEAVDSFTQQHLNDSRVQFLHQSPLSGLSLGT